MSARRPTDMPIVDTRLPATSRRAFWPLFLKYKYLYFLLMPVLAWYFIFCYIPMYGIVTAFQDYSMNKGTFGSAFVGLKHFQALFADVDFWRSFRNTVIIAAYRMIIEFPIPIIIALFLNEVRHVVYRKVLQTVVYLPHFLSWVIVASIMLTVFSPERGLIAAFYDAIGGSAPDILSQPRTFRTILIGTDIWKETGWNTIIYIAAIAGVDVCLYESALLDGAGRLKLAWHITLPGIMNVIVIMLILNAGTVLNAGFDQVFNMYNPITYETGDILDTFVYRSALKDNKLSYAAAAGLFKSVICVMVLLTSNKIASTLQQESIY